MLPSGGRLKKEQSTRALIALPDQSGPPGGSRQPDWVLPSCRQAGGEVPCDMELRQLEAFVAVATELHFGRAADKLHLGQPTLSELIRRLERELGTPLFTRTTRRVALTGAGAELLARSKTIFHDVAAATAAVNRVASGEAGTVRVGITPPAAPVLAPHLCEAFAARAPQVTVSLQPMWLPALSRAVAAGDIDVALTCGILPQPAGVVGEVFAAEPLLAGLRPGHRLAGRASVSLAELAQDVLGRPRESLFPAWALSQQQALEQARVQPPSVDLEDTDLAGTRWLDQPDAGWIMLIPSLARAHTATVIKPVEPFQPVPFTLQWNPDRAQTTAVTRFVHTALTADLPPGWLTQPGHLRHQAGTAGKPQTPIQDPWPAAETSQSPRMTGESPRGLG
jgi:DNA-binding transcriptional LysR family regulator